MATIGVFAAIFDEANRILCVRANYGSGYWSTPGGRVEPGESRVAALKREVLEETGYIIEPEELIGVYVKPYRDDLVLSFHARILAQRKWIPNEEIAEIGFYPVDNLPDKISMAARTRILDAAKNRKGVFHVFDTPDIEDD